MDESEGLVDFFGVEEAGAFPLPFAVAGFDTLRTAILMSSSQVSFTIESSCRNHRARRLKFFPFFELKKERKKKISVWWEKYALV